MVQLLPYSSPTFFLAAGVLLLVFHGSRRLLKDRIPYSVLLAAASAGFWLALLPSSFPYLAGFALYQYLLLTLAVRGTRRGLSLLLSLAPLLAWKLTEDRADTATFWSAWIGLSFMTFRAYQAIFQSEKLPAFLPFFTFLTFFPNALAGPIDRFERFREDLEDGYSRLRSVPLLDGWRQVLIGVFQKFVVAAALQLHWLDRLDTSDPRPAMMAQVALAYSAYLYFDFAGYSRMAIGLSGLLGIRCPENFDHPYLARNPADFWRRWHITLGAWLRDFVFMPLYKGLQRFGALRSRRWAGQGLALFLTFLVMGLWNGFRWHYVAVGALFGLYAFVHNSYLHFKARYPGFVSALPVPGPLRELLSRGATLAACCLALYVFSGKFPSSRPLLEAPEAPFAAQVRSPGLELTYRVENHTGIDEAWITGAKIEGNPQLDFALREQSGRWHPARARTLWLKEGEPLDLGLRHAGSVYPLGKVDRRQPWLHIGRNELYRPLENPPTPAFAPRFRDGFIHFDFPKTPGEIALVEYRAPEATAFAPLGAATPTEQGYLVPLPRAPEPGARVRVSLLAPGPLPFPGNLKGTYYRLEGELR